MIKWCLGMLSFGVFAIASGACGLGGSSNDDSPCKTGALACACYDNDTCDDGLDCLANFCLDLRGGIGGALLGEGGAFGFEAGAGGSGPSPAGGMGGVSEGGGVGGTVSQAGTTSSGGSFGTAGTAGTFGTAGTAGTAGGEPFPPNPVGCELVTTCPTCCETTGVYALDSFDRDATPLYVTSFSVTAQAAVAEFDFVTGNEVGAIFFRFAGAQNIGSLSVYGTGAGGTLEIVLVRAGGQDGCIYPIIGGELSPIPDTCWGLGAGPYAALPADQIEIRVRSSLGGRAALNVTGLRFGP